MFKFIIGLSIAVFTVLIVQYVIKPAMRKLNYHEKSWYPLSVNIAAIVIAMVLGLVVIFLFAISELSFIQSGLDILVNILGTVFIYEVLKNIHKAIKNGRGSKQ